MNLNVDISPDDERMLNDILDDGISELKDNNTLRKSEKEESRINKYYINDHYNSKLQKSSANFNQSINYKENTGEKTAKSSALRNLLNEIKSDQSSPSSSKSPVKINYSTKANTLIDSQKMSSLGRMRESSSTSRDVNFGDMKSDIRSLQDKILGLERKLCIITNYPS